MVADGRGLYLRTTPGTKNWVFRFQIGGKRHDMGLGSILDVSLTEAREKVEDLHRLIRSGVDPLADQRTRAGALRVAAAKERTFDECAEAYIAAHEASWRNKKHREQWRSTIATYVAPIFGDLPVQEVDVGLIMAVVEPLWATRPETASRVRGRIESVLDWATARGYRTGENPARWRGHLENLLPKRSKVRRVEHHAALAYAEIGGFMAELRQQDSTAARALEFAILTVGRTGEVLGARWDDVDLAKRIWIVPAERMKAGREHRVPLSDRAIEILDEMRAIRTCDFVFPGAKIGRPLNSSMALLRLLRRMNRADISAHGFRSTFSDWCAEETSFPAEARELAMAHAVGNKVEAAYRRGDMFAKRRQLADAWAQFCGEERAETVVPLRQRRP
jgi:integrase